MLVIKVGDSFQLSKNDSIQNWINFFLKYKIQMHSAADSALPQKNYYPSKKLFIMIITEVVIGGAGGAPAPPIFGILISKRWVQHPQNFCRIITSTPNMKTITSSLMIIKELLIVYFVKSNKSNF